MSKKKMLEESQIRRMFQLAGIPAIGESFIGGKYAKLAEEEEGEEKEDLEEKAHSEEEESEDKNEGMKYKKEEEEDDQNEGMKYSREEEEDSVEEGGMKYSREEEEGEPEEAAPEMDMGAEPAASEGDIPAEKIEAIVDAVLAGIEKETGVPLERVDGEGGEPAGEEPPAEEPEMAMGDAEGEEGEEDMALENQFSDQVIEEVSLRVARRLIQLTKK